MKLDSVAEVEAALRADSYLPDRPRDGDLPGPGDAPAAPARGEPGVGKTEVGKTLARVLDAELVRLQCYEGIDASQALYEWDYRGSCSRRARRAAGRSTCTAPSSWSSGRCAIRSGAGAVLLVDEPDRADDEFEAFLLEVLSDFSVTIPELGRVAAAEPPAVVVTSNRTRELHDALKRRCLYHWIEFPDLEREVEIIRVRAPEVSERLARLVAEAIARLRELDLVKPPGAAEAIDWAQALALLGFESVERDDGLETLGWAVKNRRTCVWPRRRSSRAVPELLGPVRASAPGGGTSRRHRPHRDVLPRLRCCRRRSCTGRGATLVGRRDDPRGLRPRLPLSSAAPRERRSRNRSPGRPRPSRRTPTRGVEDGRRAPALPARPRQPPRAPPAQELRRLLARGAIELARLMAGLRLAAPPRRTRRRRPAQARELDLRRTVRRALRTGGDPARPARRERRLRPCRLVLILDVSGSMSEYSRALLVFAHAALRADRRWEAFCFGTRLDACHKGARRLDPGRGARACDVGRRRLGRRHPHRRRSQGLPRPLRARRPRPGRRRRPLLDGLDTGDPALLAEQMARLHRLAHEVVWLNPLRKGPRLRAARPGHGGCSPSSTCSRAAQPRQPRGARGRAGRL